MLEEKRDRNGGRKKGREHGLQTPIQSQQTNGRPTREKRGEGRDERNIKGWDTNARHKRTWQLVESHGPNELAVSWASSNWGKARELPCVFSDRSSRSGTVHTWIKGETQSRLSESADWTRSASRDKRVIDGWPRSKQARGQLSTDHHRHNNATPPPHLCLHCGFDLIITLRSVRGVRCRMKSRKHRKRTRLYSHMFGVSPHPIWETMRVSVYRSVSNGRHEELLLISTSAILRAVFVSAPLSLPYGDFPL